MKDTRNKIHLGEVKILNIFSIFLVWTFLRTTQSGILSHLTVFFLNAIRVFCHAAFTVPFGRAFFNSYSLYPLPILASGDATGLRGTFPDHPRPFHLTFTTYTTTFIHPWAPFPTGLEPAGAGVDSSFHHPTVSPEETSHTHPWPGGGSFLGKKSSPFGGIRTH
jgi:hypothetical protein